MTYVGTKLKKEITIKEIITIHYFEYMKGFEFHGESHDFWEFLYVDKGTVSVFNGEQSYLLEAGDIIFHKPNEFHSIHSKGGKAPNLVAISFKCTSKAMEFFYEKCFTLSLDERTLLSYIISEARSAFLTPINIPAIEQVILKKKSPFGAEQLILTYLELFLITLRRKYSEKIPIESSDLDLGSMTYFSDSGVFEQILSYMKLHICEHLTIQNICQEFSLSRSALHVLFRKEKNSGVIDYFNHMKLECAKEIMRDGTMNFTEIAHYLNYSSLQYFSKQFKKAYGMSPLEYSSSVKGITQAVLEAGMQINR